MLHGWLSCLIAVFQTGKMWEVQKNTSLSNWMGVAPSHRSAAALKDSFFAPRLALVGATLACVASTLRFQALERLAALAKSAPQLVEVINHFEGQMAQPIDRSHDADFSK